MEPEEKEAELSEINKLKKENAATKGLLEMIASENSRRGSQLNEVIADLRLIDKELESLGFTPKDADEGDEGKNISGTVVGVRLLAQEVSKCREMVRQVRAASTLSEPAFDRRALEILRVFISTAPK